MRKVNQLESYLAPKAFPFVPQCWSKVRQSSTVTLVLSPSTFMSSPLCICKSAHFRENLKISYPARQWKILPKSRGNQPSSWRFTCWWPWSCESWGKHLNVFVNIYPQRCCSWSISNYQDLQCKKGWNQNETTREGGLEKVYNKKRSKQTSLQI